MPTPYQHVTAATAANPEVAVLPDNVLSGTSLFVLTVSVNTSEAITGITDSIGNTYGEVFDVTIGGSRFELWRAPNGGSGANTVSVTFSAITGSKRIWIVEVGDMGTPVTGPSDSHDQASGEDPMTLAELSGLDGSTGLVFLIFRTDTAHTLTGYQGTKFNWTAVAGGASAIAYGILGPSVGATLIPTANFNAAETGESFICAIYDEVQPGAGGGATSVPFFGMVT